MGEYRSLYPASRAASRLNIRWWYSCLLVTEQMLHVKMLLGCLALICFVKGLWILMGISSQASVMESISNASTNQDEWRTMDLGQDKMAKAMVRRLGRKTESQNVNWGWHGTFWLGAFLTTFTDLNFKVVLLLFSLRSIQIFKHREGCGEHIQSTLLMQSSLIFCIHITPAKSVHCFTL